MANFGSDNASILLGNGMGSFSAPTNFGAGRAPFSVSVGDFNLDGKPDLAVGNFISDNVSILLGNGIGSFTGPTNFAAGDASLSVAVGDFNLDGKSDLAVVNFNSNIVSILTGNGTGGFSAPTNFAAGDASLSVAVGDFNLDGKPDLAVANQNSDNVSILLGDGTGSFSAPTNFIAGTDPASVAVGDFNLDGKPDLAVANFNSNNVSILPGNGTGGFSASVNLVAGTSAVSVSVDDFNLDGKPDLAVANYGSDNVSVFLNNCTASTPTPTPTPTPAIVAAGALLVNESCPPANGAIDPGERVTVHFKLMNNGGAETSNLVATLLSGTGVVAPSNSQSYGFIAPEGVTGRDFSFTADPALMAGQTITAVLQLQDGTVALGTVSMNLTAGPSPCGGVRLVVTSTPLQRTLDTVTTTITVQNIGTLPANGVILTTAMLGSASGLIAMPNLNTIDMGASVSTQVSFTTAATGASVLKIGGTFGAGSSGTFSSTKRVTIP